MGFHFPSLILFTRRLFLIFQYDFNCNKGVLYDQIYSFMIFEACSLVSALVDCMEATSMFIIDTSRQRVLRAFPFHVDA